MLFVLAVATWVGLVLTDALPVRVVTGLVVSVVVVLTLVRHLLADRVAWRRVEREHVARREEAARRAGVPPADVPLPDLAAARRRARLRALGATLVAGATLALLWLWVAHFALEIGVYPNHLVYLLLLVTVVFFVRRERVEMKRSEGEWIQRRRRRDLKVPSPPPRRAIDPPPGTASGPAVHRTRPVFTPWRAGPAYDTMLLILIVGACIGTALVLLLGFAGRR